MLQKLLKLRFLEDRKLTLWIYAITITEVARGNWCVRSIIVECLILSVDGCTRRKQMQAGKGLRAGRSSMHVVPYRYSIEKCSKAGHKRRGSGNLMETECDESDSSMC